MLILNAILKKEAFSCLMVDYYPAVHFMVPACKPYLQKI